MDPKTSWQDFLYRYRRDKSVAQLRRLGGEIPEETEANLFQRYSAHGRMVRRLALERWQTLYESVTASFAMPDRKDWLPLGNPGCYMRINHH